MGIKLYRVTLKGCHMLTYQPASNEVRLNHEWHLRVLTSSSDIFHLPDMSCYAHWTNHINTQAAPCTVHGHLLFFCYLSSSHWNLWYHASLHTQTVTNLETLSALMTLFPSDSCACSCLCCSAPAQLQSPLSAHQVWSVRQTPIHHLGAVWS